MESSVIGWWRRHGWTVTILLSAFGISFFIRTAFMAPIISQFGPLFVYGGGSDSFYHSRVMSYIILNHHNLVVDSLLRYPTGAINPREPLFDWMNAILGIVFAPLFGGNAVVAGAFFLSLQGPLWAALGVFPVYLIGREVFSKRSGLIAALIFPFLVGNIDASAFGYANYLSFYTFFILITIYAYIRTIRTVGSRRWVESYRHPRQVLPALRQFLRVERASVKWAVFTGVSFGALAMAWQGYSYAVAVFAIFLLFAMMVERIRRVDSFGLYVVTWIVGLVGFPIAVPYYYFQGQFAGWFDLPLLVFFGVLLLLLPFLFLRDLPWVFSIPILVLIVGAGALALDLVSNAFFVNIVTGQGYFVKTLVYSTVAEAQAPSVDALILGYGVVTFFLAFVGLAIAIYELVRGRFKRWHMLFLVFAILSIYLPISAAKFFLIGSPAFALLPAEAIRRALDVGGYPELRRTVASLSDRRSQLAAFRRAFKLRHVLVMILLVGLILPNIWYAIDAGVPYNSKSQFNQQIYNSLPPPLRTNPSNAQNFYLGAAGTQLDTPAQYDEDGYNWLAQQDTNLPAPDRPAFISWWDYGFQAVAQGGHPTVADNFQNGIEAAGNFLLSQNESQAIGVLTTELLYAEIVQTQKPYLPTGLNQVLARDGLNLVELHTLLINQSKDVPLVIAHPERYLPVDPSHLSPLNAMYLTMEYFLATSLPLSGVAQVYNDVQQFTHWSIRYAMVDSRLFPFSGTNTGIFYAPADLTDRVIGPGGVPTEFFTISVLASDGNTYGIGQVPPGLTPIQYNINYAAPFYHSMLYKTFIGYNGTQIGLSGGIPGLTGAAGSSPIEPGWMLQHFQAVYKTAYFCPSVAQATSDPNCFVAKNLPTALSLANKTKGLADTSASHYFSGGETMLEYYPGQSMIGSVTLPDGTPVSNARLTVYDSWGIPHMSVLSGSDGSYSVVLPPGNDTVNVTTGPENGLSQAGTTLLDSLHLTVSNALGLSLNAPALVQQVTLKPGTVQGFVYWNTANNSSYEPAADQLLSGARIVLSGAGLKTLSMLSDASGSFLFPDVAPGVYNFNVLYGGANFPGNQAFVGAGVTVNQTTGLSPGVVTGTVRLAGTAVGGAIVSVVSTSGTVSTQTTNASGKYRISNLGPGNYTVSASLPISGYSSSAHPVTFVRPGQLVSQNLSLIPVVPVQFSVVANGNPVPNFPIRLTLIPSYANASLSPIQVGSSTNSNSSVVASDSSGVVSTRAPTGNYSIYGVGYVNGQVYSGFLSGYLGPNGGPLILPPLFLSSAEKLSGTIPVTGSAGVNPAMSFVTVYDSRGDQVTAWANSNGSFAIELPAATYSVLAVQGTISTKDPVYAELLSVDLSSDQSVPFSLSVATTARFTVGTPVPPTPSGFFPAARAQVAVSIGTNGPTVTTLSAANGNVTLFLPSTLPPGGTYCLVVHAPGFSAQSECGLSPNALAQISRVTLTLTTVSVEFAIYGLPSGTAMTLNLTAESPTAKSVTAFGGPTFSFSAFPGTYRVTAWAPSTPGGIFLPPQIANITIPLGAQLSNYTLLLLRQVPSAGTITLPSSVTLSSVSVKLTSPLVNVTVNGTTFERRFFAAPGTYSAYTTATASGTNYANLTTLSINATGVLSQRIVLTGAGADVQGSLLQPSGATLNATTSVTFVGPGGSSVPTVATGGTYSVILPTNSTFAAIVSTTVLVPFDGVVAYQKFTTASNYACSVRGGTTTCNIPLQATTLPADLNGTLNYPGFPSGLSGTLRLQGPTPSENVTTVAVANGVFSVALTPGVYTIYTTAGGPSNPLANITTVAVSPSASSPVSLILHTTWVDTVTVVAPPGVLQGAWITVTDRSGHSIVYADQPFATPLSLSLPTGTYVVSANTSGSPFGIPSPAAASATVYLLNGNAATTLSPVYQFRPLLSVGLVAPTSATIPAGGSTSFAFSVTNIGTAPVTFHMIGTPSFWKFAFSFSTATLNVSSPSNTRSGEVWVTVPAGTAVAHPPLALEAVVANGTVIGAASPAPVVNVLPYFGLGLGPTTSLRPSVTSYSATIPFYVVNHGNTPVKVSLSIADSTRLTSLGWTNAITIAGRPIPGPPTISPSANETYTVQLAAPRGNAVPPGTATVTATVLNSSGALTLTVTLTVPVVSVNLTSAPIIITGPSIGSPPVYPDWLIPVLAFVPAIGFVIGVTVFRWYRTRRWVRK